MNANPAHLHERPRGITPQIIQPYQPPVQWLEFGLVAEPAMPSYLAQGPSKTVWFTDLGSNRVGYIDMLANVREFSIGGGFQNDPPRGITEGPDRNMWVAVAGRFIARVSPGGLVALFPSKAYYGVTTGADGRVWFAEGTNSTFGAIGAVSRYGAISDYPLPQANAQAFNLTSGPDGNVWYSEVVDVGSTPTEFVGKIAPSGQVTEYSVGQSNGRDCIATGSDAIRF
jgi:streptogramin lyase